MKKEISSPKAPKAIGPYSQAIAFANLVFCSGQIGNDPKTGQLFEIPYPARATVEVSSLPKDALIEIECIAYKNFP